MSRFTRRTLAVVLGLGLGWYIAGTAGHLLPAVGALRADNPHDQTASGEAHPSESRSGDDNLSGDVAHGPQAAKDLVPGANDVPFIRPVVYAAAGLFIAAIMLGIPALALRGPEPPDPANEHAHGRDDHARH